MKVIFMTASHNISSKHLHKNRLTTKSKEASSDLTSGHAARAYKRLGVFFSATRCRYRDIWVQWPKGSV